MRSAALSRSPASARVAASIRRLVTPLIAETTTKIEWSREASFTISHTRAMQDASPTEVPPNFMTCSCFFIGIKPGRVGFERVGKSPWRSLAAPKKLYTSEASSAAPGHLGCVETIQPARPVAAGRAKFNFLRLGDQRLNERDGLRRAQAGNVIVPNQCVTKLAARAVRSGGDWMKIRGHSGFSGRVQRAVRTGQMRFALRHAHGVGDRHQRGPLRSGCAGAADLKPSAGTADA